jgi:hypothetical protein
MLYNGKFYGYVLIIQKKVGEFSIWPLNQHGDALKEFAGKGAAIHAVCTLGEEIELAEKIGRPVWEIFHDAFELVPFKEVFELGARAGFCYYTSFEELSATWEDVPEWSDLLRMNAVRN